MLPKSQRLNLKKNFKWVASGKKIETPNFKLFIKFGEQDEPLIGVAVSSKVFRGAVKRNKAKRITFRSIEQNYNTLKSKLNLVIMPKIGVLESPLDLLKQELSDVKDINKDN